jgi:transcriptional regulator with XRE-family HTH domain
MSEKRTPPEKRKTALERFGKPTSAEIAAFDRAYAAAREGKASPPAAPTERVTPSELFVRRLKEFRMRRGVTQTALADRMAAAGYPMRRKTILEIEAGTRRLSLDEALALAFALDAAPAQMLSPSDDEEFVISVHPSVGWGSSGFREWFLHGDRWFPSPEARRAASHTRAGDRLADLSLAYLDAKERGDKQREGAIAKAIAALIEQSGKDLWA